VAENRLNHPANPQKSSVPVPIPGINVNGSSRKSNLGVLTRGFAESSSALIDTNFLNQFAQRLQIAEIGETTKPRLNTWAHIRRWLC
jgi:hypothetical protein